jgi:hypothetical protein
MLDTQKRIALLAKLGSYIVENGEDWQQVKQRAVQVNSWFTAEHVDMASDNIAREFLPEDKLQAWISQYTVTSAPKAVGIVMAGNIPLVGFHDMLCGFMSGHNLLIKTSSKDEVLIKHLAGKLCEWDADVCKQIQFAEILKGCNAYIATGSNNTARYFEQYFGKYPHIIRRNRTSVAVLDGNETEEELKLLGQDVFSYFGLGCRNITQVHLPEGYDLQKLFDAFRIYEDVMHHHKYKNNYDYQLAIYLLNNVPYLTTDSLLLVENEIPFSAVSVLHYKYYTDFDATITKLKASEDIQCIEAHEQTAFGGSQSPSFTDYADGVDTMQFLSKI